MSLRQDASFNAFWEWWWPSVTAWLPENLRIRFAPRPNIQTIRWTGNAPEPIAQSLNDDADVVLVLPGRSSLVRALQLPGSAAARLRDIALFEIERQTPFTPNQVYFDAVLEHPFQRGQSTLLVKLVVVPRGTLDTAIEATAAHTKRLIAVDVEGVDGISLGANLLPAPLRYRPSERWRRWNLALALICAIAIFGTLMGLLHARQRAVTQLELQATALLGQAAQVEQREWALVQARQLSSGETQSHPPTSLDLLSQLSAALPLDSHFLQIELNDGVVTARGQTTDLSAVLRALRDSALWNPPELTGSRTLPDGKMQEFSLRLHVRDRTGTHTP